MVHLIQIIIVVLIGLLLSACSSKAPDRRLLEADLLTVTDPEKAMLCLDSISPDSLPEPDRHLYDLLTIKARDKAYIYHTSDSLILDVVAYFSTHRRPWSGSNSPSEVSTGRSHTDYYPEALYYAGRVYSDLGDAPTALDYFQQALDQLPSDTENTDLRLRVLSQTGRLLTNLRLYDEAVDYIEASINLNREQLKDSVGVMYDLQLLGGTYLRADKYGKAEKYFREAQHIAKYLQKEDEIMFAQFYLAEVKHKQDNLDSALLLIRGIPERIDPVMRNSALGYASNIYYDAGVFDTAYMYAEQLIHSPDPAHREIGYQVILYPELRKYIPSDSLNRYISNYRSILESFHNQHSTQLAINQEALYNYKLHDRDKARAEKTKGVYGYWLIGTVFLILLLILLYLRLRIRQHRKIIRLQQAIDELARTKQLTSDRVPEENVIVSDKPSEQHLRERLREELMSLAANDDGKTDIAPVLLDSEPYRQLQQLIEEGRVLKDKNPLWDGLDKVVAEAYPQFKSRLDMLTSSKITPVEYRTALLLKCGIRPAQMTVLLAKSNGAIISRRETLGLKIFDKKVRVKDVDLLISYL